MTVGLLPAAIADTSPRACGQVLEERLWRAVEEMSTLEVVCEDEALASAPALGSLRSLR